MASASFEGISVVTSTACPKGKAFLVGPPDEDGKRECVAVVGLLKESRWSRARRFFGEEVPEARGMLYLYRVAIALCGLNGVVLIAKALS